MGYAKARSRKGFAGEHGSELSFHCSLAQAAIDTPMRPKLFSILTALALGGLCTFFYVREDGVLSDLGAPTQSGTLGKDNEFTPMVQPTRSLPPPEIQDSAVTLESIPLEFRGVTADPKAVRYIQGLDHRQVGRIVKTADNRQQLVLDDNTVFEARLIRDRTISRNGTLAVAAVFGKNPPLESEQSEVRYVDNVAILESSSMEVWVVREDKSSIKISPDNVHAKRPSISPDGTYVAYTGRKRDLRGIPGEEMLYITNLATGEIVPYRGNGRKDSYMVSPGKWSDDGLTLAVLEDYGETGGHLTLQYLQVR